MQEWSWFIYVGDYTKLGTQYAPWISTMQDLYHARVDSGNVQVICGSYYLTVL